MFRILLIFVLTINAMSVSATHQIVIELQIEDASYLQPRFQAPSVRYELRSTKVYNAKAGPLNDYVPKHKMKKRKSDREYYSYQQWPIHTTHAANRFVHFVFDNLNNQEYLPVNPFLQTLKMSSERTGSGTPLVRVMSFDSRSSIAETYKRQANKILQSPNYQNRNSEAYGAALSAIMMSPEVDNFLLLVRVLGNSLRTDDVIDAPFSYEKLRSIPSYMNLSFPDQWVVQTAILDTLTATQDIEKQIDPTRRVLDVAIELGNDMIDQIDFDNPDQTRLTVSRVYQALSYLHHKNNDCVSLHDNNRKAIERSVNIEMNWSTQRVILLDWADCLEKITGIGSGPNEEKLIEEAAQSASISEAWNEYLTVGTEKHIIKRLDRDPSAGANRIREILEFAKAVKKRSDQ
ncbi:MAG: hypothetical protein OXC17_11450 [Aestuariivita sp.]|nr:hypothetical protein [Aestuariivita sp.]